MYLSFNKKYSQIVHGNINICDKVLLVIENSGNWDIGLQLLIWTKFRIVWFISSRIIGIPQPLTILQLKIELMGIIVHYEQLDTQINIKRCLIVATVAWIYA